MPVTVSRLNQYIKGVIENDASLCDVSVKGEISNFKLHSSGHCYLTLKDEQSAIRAVMFRSAAQRLKFMPENGMKIIAAGKVSVYERDGQYQLYIASMQQDGVGDLYVAFEQLKARLAQEGLFDQSRKKPLPKYPKTVGVITSPTGAAVRDIINVLSRRYPAAEILLCPVLVQGDDAARQIASAIAYMNREKRADVLIVGRGGGSIEDLWSFNEETVARAIAASELPVISAVGHETDFTIADFVADLRAPTPSAAAELAVPSILELKNTLSSFHSRICQALQNTLAYKRSIISGFTLKSPLDFINQNRLRTDHASQRLTGAAAAALEAAAKRFAVAAAGLDALSPLNVLSRGYSVTQGRHGILKSVQEVQPGDDITVRLQDGALNCSVNQIIKE